MAPDRSAGPARGSTPPRPALRPAARPDATHRPPCDVGRGPVRTRHLYTPAEKHGGAQRAPPASGRSTQARHACPRAAHRFIDRASHHSLSHGILLRRNRPEEAPAAHARASKSRRLRPGSSRSRRQELPGGKCVTTPSTSNAVIGCPSWTEAQPGHTHCTNTRQCSSQAETQHGAGLA